MPAHEEMSSEEEPSTRGGVSLSAATSPPPMPENLGQLAAASARNPAGVTSQILIAHFHLPLHTVASKFGMCTTAFKKTCRRLGIAKWPHRQLRGMDKRIAALKAEVNYASSGDRQRFLAGLSSLEEEKARLARGILGGEDCDLAMGMMEETVEDEERGTPPPAARNSGHDQAGMSDGEDSLGEDEPRQSPAQNGDSLVISEKEVIQHFHLPLHTAAQRFGVCTTAFKKLCRRFGIAKWPHRQLRGIDKRIAALKAELNYATGDREMCRKSLLALQEEKARLSRTSGSGSQHYALPGARARTSPAPSHSQPIKAESPSLSPAADEDDDDDEEEEMAACASALDLLAAVAGVKEKQDREEEQQRRLEVTSPCSTPCSAPGSTVGDDDNLDTPPLDPESPLLSKQPRVKLCISPMMKYAPSPVSCMDPVASSPLIGLSWTGECK